VNPAEEAAFRGVLGLALIFFVGCCLTT